MTSLTFHSVSKNYPVYNSPGDRLKELASFNRLHRHHDFWALQDVSFEVKKASTFCLIGENGSGKSTTLQLSANIFPPTQGKIEVRGRVSALLELGAGFNPEFSGRENVFLNGAILGLSSKEIQQRYGDIEDFAEIGDFINQPVKTYSTGMLVRLAFAVAINVEPEILLVDEALAVGDHYFRQRCMRKVHELRRRQVTILFVSHSMADVKAIGTEAMWLENGRLVEIGSPERVTSHYLARMIQKDTEYLQMKQPKHERQGERSTTTAPEIVETIPNIDFRHGNGAAEVIGVAALDEHGHPIELMDPKSRLTIRISVRAHQPLDSPNVGFMMRNHLGIDFSGTNTARENATLPPMKPGDIHTVDFHVDLPELYPGNFSISPAIADGPLDGYRMCDWIDNAITLQMSHGGSPIYGYIHLPCQVAINSRLPQPRAS